jgi:2-phosphosulfolactate phosphatase
MSSSLRVLRKSLLAGANEAEGVAVVIDVLRAFTTAAVMVHLGAEGVTLLAETDAVLSLKQAQGYLAAGEVGGRRPPGFDLGNSPSRALDAPPGLFEGRMVAQRTSAGTQGAVAAAHSADALILGSYVTAGAIARYILGLSPLPGVVSLVAMGDEGASITPDDEACADYLEHLLLGRPYDHTAALREILGHNYTQLFLRGNHEYAPPEDLVLCLQRDLFDFVLVASDEDGQLVSRRVDVPPAEVT